MKHIKKFSVNEAHDTGNAIIYDAQQDPKKFLQRVKDQFEMMVDSKMKGEEEKALAKHFLAILPFIYASVAPRNPQTLLDNMKDSDIMQKHPMRLEVADLIELMYLTDMSAGRYGKDYYNDMLRSQGRPYSSLKGDEPAPPRR
jgi:hypothetical protein